MYRRQLLKAGGSVIAFTGVVGTVSADADADPRPEPQGGTKPNENAPESHTGALPGENVEIPVGHWVVHDNSWGFYSGQDKDHVGKFANESTQKFIIDGEEFVLDSYEDWEYSVDDDGTPRLSWDYTTPPKKKGKEYTVRWEAEWDDEPIDGSDGALENFPFQNEVEIVKRNR